MIAYNAESARGIAPRGAHRSGLEPLDSSGSCHPMKTAVLHLDRNGSSCCQLTKPTKTQVACPFASRALPRFRTTTRQSAPAPRVSTFGLAGLPLVPFPLAPSAGSQVPYQSPG
jgi:hypothetical protein